MDEDQAFDFAVVMVEELEEEATEANEKVCGDRLEHCGKIFTYRVKGPHRIHDDYEQTDGMPQRWMGTSLGRLTPEGANV